MNRIIQLPVALLCIVWASILPAQNGLFLPKNLKKTYTTGTRSADGKPGPKYWTNRAAYNMEVSIEPTTHVLSGTAIITYTNNSPDTLKMIRLKLAHDLYKKNGQRSYDVPVGDVDDGVRIKSLTFNGNAVLEKQQNRANTFLDIRLQNTPLLPQKSATITVEWDYRMPLDPGATRECVCDSGTYFVAYWYPQVAVYDDLRGWADVPYNGVQEFYNDFADYNVTIAMPRGFQVWATGEWQNMDEILTKDYRERWQAAQKSNEIVHIFTAEELKKDDVYKKGAVQKFRFEAKDVPDFAFALSNHYNWDASSVVVDARTGRRTFVSAAYHSDSKDYYKVARIAADGIALMSTWMPGYPFPYPSMTVFNGNDGMEYPMMCNDATVPENFVTSLTVHEIAHTYFPFMMGINEQDNAWMDEGWASFFDYMLADSMTNGKEGELRGYADVAGVADDVPPIIRSSNLRGRAYGIAAYTRPQAAYATLYDLLGEKVFHQCMTTYIDRWKGKHPTPYDFFNTWNEASGQDLNWFWQPWFFEWGKPDLAIKSVESVPNSTAEMILIEKVGSIPIAMQLDIEYTDGVKHPVHHTASVWRSGNTEMRIFTQPGKKIKSVVLNNLPSIPDADSSNNTWKR